MKKRVGAVAGTGTGLLWAALVCIAPVQAQIATFPNTSPAGEAAVQYRDGTRTVLAAYYYSQRHHDSGWLMIEAGIASDARTIIHREDIMLVTPAGREVPLASQARFAEAVRSTRLVVQNAETRRFNFPPYFANRPWREPIRFFELPGSGRIVGRDARVDREHLALGDLFFEAPDGVWTPGTHALVIRLAGERVALPIELK